MAQMQLKQSAVTKVATGDPTQSSSNLAVVLAFAAIYLIWGSTYLAIRYAIETLPPFLMAATRFLVAGGLLFGWSILTDPNSRPSFKQWRRALVVGALLLLCGNGGVTWAEKYIASGLAALLIATEPLWIVLMNWGLSHKRPSSKVIIGVFVGLAGVALLVGSQFTGSSSTLTMSWIGTAVVLLSSLAWAAGSLYSSRRPICASTSMASGMQMLAGGFLLLIFGLATGDAQRLNFGRVSTSSVLALGYLIIFGSLIAFTAYSWLLRNVAPARVATYAYVNPAVAVFLGWLIASEPLTARMLIAAAAIVVSVVLITSFGREQSTVEEADEHSTDSPRHPCA